MAADQFQFWQGYAWEITTKEGGWGLDGILNSRKSVLNGIVNGVDLKEWNPATDTFIAANYSAANLAGLLQSRQLHANHPDFS